VGRLHYTETTGTLYFYGPDAGPQPFHDREKHAGVCTVCWLWDGAVYLKALRADLDRAAQRDLWEWLDASGIKTVHAEREPGRSLPMARRIDDHLQIDVAELGRRLRWHEGRACRPGDPAPPPGRRVSASEPEPAPAREPEPPPSPPPAEPSS
jgi:hypothetical protein